MYMQLSPNNEYCSIARYYRGVLLYVSRIVSRVERDGSHPCSRCNAGMNNYWRHGMSHKIGLITDYNDSIDNDNYPCKLPTNSIIVTGCDNKSNI